MNGERRVDLERLVAGKVGDTEWTVGEIYMLGEAVLNAIGTAVTLGHKSPASTLDYLPEWSGRLDHDVIADLIAWTSGRKVKRPGCEERLREHIVESGWTRHQLERSAEALGLGEQTEEAAA